MFLPLIASGGVAALGAGWLYERSARRRAQQHALPGRYVELDGYRLHLTDEGAGGPTTVILHGAGESSFSWAHVRREAARFTRVVSLDRPGLGASELRPAGAPADPVVELRRALAAAELTGPFVLVGHSLGGLIARLFATRYPAEVAGLVLIDSTHERLKDDVKFRRGFGAVGVMLRVLRATSGVGLPRILGELLGVMPMYPERKHYAEQLPPDELDRWSSIVYRNFASAGAAQEFKSVFGLLDEAAQNLATAPRPQFGELPLAVVTQPGFGTDWLEMQQELSMRSTDRLHLVSDRNGHNVQMTRPELVVGAIRHVIERVRLRGV